MAWSITNYDTLHILYTDIYGDSRIIRKSHTQFYVLYQGEDAVEMSVTSGHRFANHNVWQNQAVPMTYGLAASYMPNSWTNTLYYYDAITPIATSPQDLVIQLYLLLQIDSDVVIQKNGLPVGQRTTLNFIEGANMTITAADDPINTRIDLTFASAGGGGGGDDPFPKILMMMGG
jgi:hypothetical protein